MSEKIKRHFYCKNDRHYFLTDQYIINDSNINYAECEICGKPVEEVPYFYANLTKMWNSDKSNHCGPKTQEGKKRSSMNGFKHGLYTKQHFLLAPALTGKYPECEECSYKEECKEKFKYCPINLSLMLKYLQAFEEGKIQDIKSFAGLTQGWAFNTLRMMFQHVFSKGVVLPKTIKTVMDDETGESEIVLEEQVNPLLKRIPDFMNALGFLADQQMMTPAKKQDQDNIAGFLQNESGKTEDIKKFMDDQKDKMNELKNKISKAIEKRKEDQALKDYEKEESKE